MGRVETRTFPIIRFSPTLTFYCQMFIPFKFLSYSRFNLHFSTFILLKPSPTKLFFSKCSSYSLFWPFSLLFPLILMPTFLLLINFSAGRLEPTVIVPGARFAIILLGIVFGKRVNFIEFLKAL